MHFSPKDDGKARHLPADLLPSRCRLGCKGPSLKMLLCLLRVVLVFAESELECRAMLDLWRLLA